MITARLLDHGDYTRLERTQAPNSDVTVVENYLTKSWANQSLFSTNWICFEVAVQFGSNRTKLNDSKKDISGFTMNIMIWGDIIWLDAKVAQTRRKSMTLPVDTTPRLGFRLLGFRGSVASVGGCTNADQRLRMKIRMVRGFGKIEDLYRLSTYFNQCIEKIFGRHSEDALVAMDLHQIAWQVLWMEVSWKIHWPTWRVGITWLQWAKSLMVSHPYIW